MPRDSSKRTKFAHAAFGCMLGSLMLVVGGVGAAIAGDDDPEEDNLPDAQFLRNVLKGFGLQRGDNSIDYHERSPLVVPPTRDLPAPEADAAAKPNNAAWPTDPDVKRHKDAKAAARKVSSVDESRPLTPAEMQPNGGAARGTSQPIPRSDSDLNGAPLSPTQLGFNGWNFNNLFGSKPDNATFASEPPRNSLTQPPVGYLTPSPNQPYGVGKETTTTKAYDYANQHGTD